MKYEALIRWRRGHEPVPPDSSCASGRWCCTWSGGIPVFRYAEAAKEKPRERWFWYWAFPLIPSLNNILGNVSIQPLHFFMLTTTFFKKISYLKLKMKKVIRLHRHHFFVWWTLHTGLSGCGSRHSGGGRGLCRSPGSVITIDRSIMYRRFYETIIE